MTKKRFVKLAMAHGLSRNESKGLARHVNLYGSYDTMYGNKMKACGWLYRLELFYKGLI